MEGNNVIPLPQLVSLGNAMKEYEVHKDNESYGQIITKSIIGGRNNDDYYSTTSIINKCT